MFDHTKITMSLGKTNDKVDKFINITIIINYSKYKIIKKSFN